MTAYYLWHLVAPPQVPWDPRSCCCAAVEQDAYKNLAVCTPGQEEAAAEAEASGAGGDLVRVVLLSELERVKYLMRVYLRTRLHKIEEHAAAILDDAEVHDRLSPREQQYVQVCNVNVMGPCQGVRQKPFPAASRLMESQTVCWGVKDYFLEFVKILRESVLL